MRLKYKFETEKIGEKFIAIAVDEDADKYEKALKVNEYGRMLFKLLQNDVTREELISRVEPYFKNKEIMNQEIDDFLKILIKENLLIE